MNAIATDMGDPDGNFVSAFQSSGFHARVFELACYAYLVEAGTVVDRSQVRPDFMVLSAGSTLAVEAVTANPRAGDSTDVSLRALQDVPLNEMLKKCGDEFPIRVGSPLFSKLGKRYWELPHCRGQPFVLLIGPFHEAGSQMYVDENLARYLYGADRLGDWTDHNGILLRETPIAEHTFEGKTIPSNFFGQPGAENVSAILYCNQFSVSKFFRMAAQHVGVPTGVSAVVRGARLLDDGYSVDWFQYSLTDPAGLNEDWTWGVTLFENPNALHPLPSGCLQSTSTFHVRDGRLVRDVYGFHSLTSWMQASVPPVWTLPRTAAPEEPGR